MILAWFLSVPRWAKLAAAGALLVLMLFTLHRCAISDAVDADRAVSAAEALQTAREADAAAVGAVGASKERIDAQNKAASDAADASDDPLKAGLDSLRKGK